MGRKGERGGDYRIGVRNREREIGVLVIWNGENGRREGEWNKDMGGGTINLDDDRSCSGYCRIIFFSGYFSCLIVHIT